MRARLAPVALALLQAGTAAAQVEAEAIPKPELQLLSEVVRLVKRDFAGATDDAVLASGCADAVASQSGTSERAAKTLDAIPPLLMRARAAAPADATYRKLTQACIEGIVGLLDLHSKFLGEAEVRGLYRRYPVAGTGIEVRKDGDALVVTEVATGTPAEKAGARAQDRVLRIDGAPVGGLTQAEAAERLRGTVGSAVNMTLERAGSRKPIEVALKREIIRVPAAHAQWSDGDVLQLRILRFTESTRGDLLREIAALPDSATREPRGVVLDLRDNAGGTLLSAVDASGLFLADGAEVGATHGRGFRLIASYRASERERAGYYYGPALPERLARALKRVPIAVLVNQHTAAGAEILAAALQGNGRAQLVGSRTLGMGSVQTLFPLAGGAALRMTTAYWHAPKDVLLEGRPLRPDVAAAPEGAMREALRSLAEARQ